MEKLLQLLKEKKRWNIILHNNPDPDCIASSFGLHFIFQKFKIKSRLFYNGIIGRAENKEMVKILKIPLNPLSELKFNRKSNFALLDSQFGSKNQPLNKNYVPKIVIDHHPLKKQTLRADFVDVRPDYGSTSTIIGEYIQKLNLIPDTKVATALYYGIKTDTAGFTRNFSENDAKILDFIHSYVSFKLLGKIEHPPLNKNYYHKTCEALNNAEFCKNVIISDVGKADYPDICAEIADYFIRMKNKNWVLVFSEFENNLYFSIRTKSRYKIAGKIAISLTRGIGSGGGHNTYAAGVIPLKNVKNIDELKAKLKEKFLKRVAKTGCK